MKTDITKRTPCCNAMYGVSVSTLKGRRKICVACGKAYPRGESPKDKVEKKCEECGEIGKHSFTCPIDILFGGTKVEPLQDEGWERLVSDIQFHTPAGCSKEMSCPSCLSKLWLCKPCVLKEIENRVRSYGESVRKEEYQFMLNILDGIDIADAEMGNKGGGTKAIRMALKARYGHLKDNK